MRYVQRALVVVLAALALFGASAVPQAAVAQEPETAVQPTQGPPGTTFAFFARGLDNNANFAFWATAPNGEVFGGEANRTRSFGDRADWTWTSPGNAQSGVWSMVIQRVDREDDDDEEKAENRRNAKTIQFVIGDGSAPPPAPAPAPGTPAPAPSPDQQAVQPLVGAPGDQFAFFATGYTSGERVSFWVNAPDGSVLRGGNTDAVGSGRADWRWTAPSNATAGFYSMVARGVESGVERVIAFEIR